MRRSHLRSRALGRGRTGAHHQRINSLLKLVRDANRRCGRTALRSVPIAPRCDKHNLLGDPPPRLTPERPAVIGDPGLAPLIMNHLAKVRSSIVVAKLDPAGWTDLLRPDSFCPRLKADSGIADGTVRRHVYVRLLFRPSTRASQESFDAQILVQIWPVDSFPVADQFPFPSFARVRVQQAREPRQGHRETTSIDEIDGEFVGIRGNVGSAGVHVGSSGLNPPVLPG
jgi:hypothetical protein